MPISGEIDDFSVVRDGGTVTVTVTPGLTEPVLGLNYLCIVRDKHILPPIPIGTSVAPVTFIDSGLNPSNAKAYSYDAFIANIGPTWCVTGGRVSEVAEAPTIEPPQFANGTPIASIVFTQQVVQIDWTGTTPGATGVRVEASLDGVAVRVVGTGALASGSVIDPQPGQKLYRLVATNGGTDVIVGPWKFYVGLEPPLVNPANPTFENGTPKVVFGSTFPRMTITIGIEWRASTPGAAYIRIMRATAGAGGPFAMPPGGLSSSVLSGTWTAPIDTPVGSTYVGIEAWFKLEALASDGSTVLASSSVVHWIPPA